MPRYDAKTRMIVIDDTVADADWPKRTNDVIEPRLRVVKKERRLRDVLGEWMFGKAEPRDADGDGMVYDGTKRQRPARPGAMVRGAKKAVKQKAPAKKKTTGAAKKPPENLNNKHDGINPRTGSPYRPGGKPPAGYRWLKESDLVAWKKIKPITVTNDDGSTVTYKMVLPTPGARSVVVPLNSKTMKWKAYNSTGWEKLNAYHPAHQATKKADKFRRLRLILKEVPKLDPQILEDAEIDSRAGAILLMRRLGLRQGSDDELGAKGMAFGATNLRRRHIKISGNKATLTIIEKQGKPHTIVTTDPDVLRVLKSYMNDPKFAKAGPEGPLWGDVPKQTAVNKLLREYMPNVKGAKAHDMRTLYTTSLAIEILSEYDRAPDKEGYLDLRAEVLDIVAKAINDTPKIADSTYIDPTVWDEYTP